MPPNTQKQKTKEKNLQSPSTDCSQGSNYPSCSQKGLTVLSNQPTKHLDILVLVLNVKDILGMPIVLLKRLQCNALYELACVNVYRHAAEAIQQDFILSYLPKKHICESKAIRIDYRSKFNVDICLFEMQCPSNMPPNYGYNRWAPLALATS